MKITEIKANPNNPRVIKDDKFKKLCKSIKEFPEMMALRPIIVDENNIALGGNMRLQALKTLGYDEIPNEWIKKASDLTETQKKEFIIKDNSNYGEWDFDLLANEWSEFELDDWGLDIPDLQEQKKNETYKLVIKFENEEEKFKAYDEFLLLGYKCKL
jgi:ParB-like chromosome segregation protein Spo0J